MRLHSQAWSPMPANRPAGLTRARHIARHKELHLALDELVADFLEMNDAALPSNTTVMDLMRWSHRQTVNPTEKRGE